MVVLAGVTKNNLITLTDFSAPWHLHQATALGVLVWLLLSDTWVDWSQSLAILQVVVQPPVSLDTPVSLLTEIEFKI